MRGRPAELCAVHRLDWLSYEQAGVKVDMASARAKTPKLLREQLAAFVVRVSGDVDRIGDLEDAAEIMVEYQQTLDAAKAVCAVQNRRRRTEEQKAAQKNRVAARERVAEMVRRVEAMEAAAAVEAPEPVVVCSFIVKTSRSKLRRLKEFLNMEGIQYE